MAESADGAASPEVYEWRRDPYLVSTDKRRVDLAVVHGFLTASYWASGVPLEVVQRSIEHSLVFGVYAGEQQAGFARVITDYATFAYLADVFILEAYRGQGLSRWLMECIIAHPNLQGLRRWTLFTRDAHGLYEKVGFQRAANHERLMERSFPDVYKKTTSRN
ncbi:MAG TPA: GNAT family N-acetyltransferase [Ktedonobacterales bacterium]